MTAAMRRPEGEIEAGNRRSLRTSLVVLYSWTVVSWRGAAGPRRQSVASGAPALASSTACRPECERGRLEGLKGGCIVTSLSGDPVISMSAILQLGGQSPVRWFESPDSGIGSWDEGYSSPRRNDIELTGLSAMG